MQRSLQLYSNCIPKLIYLSVNTSVAIIENKRAIIIWWWLRDLIVQLRNQPEKESQYAEWYYKHYVEEIFAVPSLLDEIYIIFLKNNMNDGILHLKELKAKIRRRFLFINSHIKKNVQIYEYENRSSLNWEEGLKSQNCSIRQNSIRWNDPRPK